MQDIATLLSAFDANTRTLTERILGFETNWFEVSPSEGAWSAAALSEHLYVFDKFVYALLQAETSEADRPADEKIPLLLNFLTNRETKIQSPQALVPLGKIKDQQVIVEKINTVRENLRTFIATADLTPICLYYTLPRLGPLTRLEWVHFILIHAERHLHQFNDIANTIILLKTTKR